MVTAVTANQMPVSTVEKDQGAADSEVADAKVGKLWAEIASSDLTKLISNLKAAGFSKKMIREIIGSLISDKYQPRIEAARGFGKDTPYWKASNIFYGGDKRMLETNKLYREMNREIRSVLGSDFFAIDEESLPFIQRQYGNLPAEKLDKLFQIQMDYQELMADYQMGGTMLPADREKLKLLQKEQRADLEKLLTPEELFEYDLRNSPVSWRLRGWNETFDLTEAEYRALFPLYQKLEDQFPSDQGPSNQDAIKARRAAEDQMQEQIKSTLGEQRYAEYKQSRDQNAYQENKLVLRLGLPLTTAAELVVAKNSFQDQTRTIVRNKELTDAQKKEQLIAAVQAAQSRVTTLLGERGAAIYRDYGGNWLKTASENASRIPSP
ncbi:MAG: hypothetical protein QM790_01070 [Nibricoccus sp.]